MHQPFPRKRMIVPSRTFQRHAETPANAVPVGGSTSMARASLMTMMAAAALYFVVWKGTDFLFSLMAVPGAQRFSTMASAAVVTIICLGVYKFAIAKMGRFQKDELKRSGAVPQAIIGLAGGVALVTIIVSLSALLGIYKFGGRGGGYDVMVIILALGVSGAVVEEILFRGIIFRWTEEALGSHIALALSSALFGLSYMMMPGAHIVGGLAFGAGMGALLGGAYMLTRSLWVTIGVHMGWNIAIALVWGVPLYGVQYDGILQGRMSGHSFITGGDFGLAGSPITVIVGVTLGLWLMKQARAEGYWLPFGWQTGIAQQNDGE